ncbi:glycerol-3-phosphate dehydrogenase/oxidase [Brevibacillus daliensis]|uniref:glycerol-3-phosphate dehydrogenase/oxidase n=1 Tax=Brevibacillus daliensis TaxID=2892995 RepID=UPI001E3E764A
MEETVFDLLVIGGGITGAGIALDASKRGMKVGLVEQADFASGTSSRSTKLIHGGLRYLKQGEVKLVQEVGRERAILYRNAPHLVIAAPMLLPIYKGGTYGYWASSVGLYIYDWLAGVERKERRKMLSKENTHQQEPLLRSEGLQGGGLYFEYRTDDARLTLDIMKTASQQGAMILNYAKVTDFTYGSDQRVTGVEVMDQISQKTWQFTAKHVVNATGPWVDQVRDKDGSLAGKRLFLTKGVHLVVAKERLPVAQSAYFDTPDGRMVFVIPRGDSTYIGTTDTAYEGPIDKPRTTMEDRDYLLKAVNAMFPDVKLQSTDILSHWAGLRPLIYEEGKGPSELSRKDEIFHSPTGLITIAGGKLTGFRKMAEKVVDLIAKSLLTQEGKQFPGCTTDQIVISGGEHEGYHTFNEWTKELMQQGKQAGIPGNIMAEWIEIYGTNVVKIMKQVEQLQATGSKQSDEMLLEAQIRYSIEEEMTVHAVDFLRLRTGWTYFRYAKAKHHAMTVVRLMGGLLGWSEQRKSKETLLVKELFDLQEEYPELKAQ